jgi:hypothetical protein
MRCGMKTFVVTIALSVFCIGSASAVGVAGADHNWTVHVGDSYYGLSGYPATTLPGIRIPAETRLHFGTHAFSLPIPFHWVASIGFGLLGGIAGASVIVWKRKK